MATCDYTGLNMLAQKANDYITEKGVENFLKQLGGEDTIRQTGSKSVTGGRKRRSKKGGANPALVHSICLMILGGAAGGGIYLGVAAATKMGYFAAAQRLWDTAQVLIEGCGDVTEGLARKGAQQMANRAGFELGPVACSNAWRHLEQAQERLTELTMAYSVAGGSVAGSVTVAAYGRLYAFVEAILDGRLCDISGHNNLPGKPERKGPGGDGPGGNPQAEVTQGGARRRRKGRKSCGGRKSRRGRKSRGGRKSRRRQ